MKIRVQLTEKDYMSAYWLALRGNRTFRLMMMFVAINGLGMAIYNFVELARGEVVDVTRWLIVGLMGLFAWAAFVRGPSQMKKAYRVRKQLQMPYEIELGEEGLKWTSEQGYLAQAWSDLLKWRVGDDLIAIYQTGAVCFLLPRHAFAAEADFQASIEILRSKMGTPA
ncbi:YcxB family protein [Luteolibacter sp. LG18]|uniref:YcxB family protein n=1 Tax=Luteolibacter sp. LG18 TaxID=2819286 RepID=UPI002B2EC1D4|nr:hypothetical protein llg_04080 [Luteolibacter sp. LG18]